MKIYSLNTNIIPFKASKDVARHTIPSRNESQRESTSLEKSLDALAISTIARLNSTQSKNNIPQKLYHLTSKRNYASIMNSGKLIPSTWEKVQEGLEGVYMVDKDNFINTWFNKKYPSIFPEKENDKKQPSMGEQILRWTSRGDDFVVIEIPTKDIDLSKLRIRPYLQAYNQVFETMNIETGEYNDELFREGLPLSKLDDYEGSDEPLEFVYMGEIPSNIFSNCRQIRNSENLKQIISEIF